MDDLKCTQLLDRFLMFYDQASIEQADLSRKLELWTKYYDFPHVPPGYKKHQLSKEMLEYGWGQYPLIYDQIKYFEMEPIHWQERLSQIKQTLNVRSSVSATILFFVGTFETDAFIVEEKNEYLLCFPVEIGSIDFRMTQELTRMVNCKESGMAPSHTRTLAQLIFQEGIALHTAHQLLGEEQRNDAIPYFKDEACTREPNRVMMNILSHLDRTDYEALYSFTKGTGASGFEKEANYTGWNLVQYLLNQGATLNELASLKAEDVDNLVEKSLYSILNKAYLTQPQE